MKVPSKFTSRLEKFSGDLWGHFFDVPVEIAEKYIDGTNRRVVCTIMGEHEYQCALMPKGDGTYFININKKIRDKLGLQLGDEIEAEIEKDKSQYGLPVPEEFEEVMRQDPEGKALFEKLTPGKQRTLLYIAGNIKDTEKRIFRAFTIMDHLKMNKGQIDFKQLNNELKQKGKI